MYTLLIHFTLPLLVHTLLRNTQTDSGAASVLCATADTRAAADGYTNPYGRSNSWL
jgi:hypothetical protein